MAANMLKTGDKNTDEDREPGVVYIGHVPHGFYEKQLKDYFSQFGKVLSIKLSRSKKSGKSKGYAFVKFLYSAVAKTVAETCHNYLFFNKLLKCEYKPMSEVHKDTFFSYKWKANTKKKRLHNSAKTTERLEDLVQRSLRRKRNKLDKLKELGIDLKLEDVMNVAERPKRKQEAKTPLKEKVASDVENVTSQELPTPPLSAKAPKKGPKSPSTGRKTRKSKPPVTTEIQMSAVVSPSTGVKGKRVRTPLSAKTLKVTTKSSSAGVKGRKPKPPPAKKLKRE